MADGPTVLARLISALQLTDPAWDINPGTPEYKILEATAQEIATAANNSTLQSYSQNINTKSGADLDAFVANYGVTRLPGTSAVGSATFSANGPGSSNYFIPMGTQVYVPASAGNSVSIVYFQTTAPGIILQNSTSIELPIQATLPGSTGNVVTGAINSLTNSLVGVTSVTNTNPTSGGTNAETDAQLRARFQATVFRNLAGTQDQFLNVCFNNSNVSRVNVVGPQTRIEEQLQVVSQEVVSLSLSISGGTPTTGVFTLGYVSWNGSSEVSTSSLDIPYNATAGQVATALAPLASSGYLTPGFITSGGPLPTTPVTITGTRALNELGVETNTLNNSAIPVVSFLSSPLASVTSEVPDDKYTFPSGGELVGINLNTVNQSLALPGYAYTYFQQIPLLLQFLTSNGNPWLDPPNVVDVEWEYTPLCSRNNPAGSPPITNKVDIFTDGLVSQTVSSAINNTSLNTFTSLGPSQTWVTNNGSPPPGADYFFRLFPSPLPPGSGDNQPLPDSLVLGIPSGGSLTVYAGVSPTFIRGDANPVTYYPVYDSTPLAGSPLAFDGIGVKSSFTPGSYNWPIIQYQYNSLTADLNDQIQNVRLVGTDVLAHEAQIIQVQVNLTIVIGVDQSQLSITQAIITALSNYFTSVQYSGSIRAASVIQTAMGVGGVVNCRITTPADASTGPTPSQFGIQVIANDGTTVLATYPSPSTLTTSGTVSGGTYTLSWDGVATSPIAYNATDATILSDLQSLPNFPAGSTVTGGPLPGTPVSISIPQQGVMTFNGASLTGGGTYIFKAFPSDIFLSTNQLPALFNVNTVLRAENTF